MRNDDGNTVWFQTSPGDRQAVIGEEDGSAMILIHNGEPDWVTVPEQLGGGRLRVETSITVACPCGEGHTSKALALKSDPPGLCVAECLTTHQFYWFRFAVKEDAR